MEGTVTSELYWLTNLIWFILVVVLAFRLNNSVSNALVSELIKFGKEGAEKTASTADDRIFYLLEKVTGYLGFGNTDTPPTTPTDPAPPTQPPPTGEQPVAINQNIKLLGDTVVEEIPTSDGRYQFQPNLYEVVVEPGNIGVPPYINKVPNANGDGNHAKIEITEINGKFGYRTFVTLEAGKCYLLKLTGTWAFEQIGGNGQLQDVRLGGRVITDSGAITVFNPEGFNSWFGGKEAIFAFKSEVSTGAYVYGFVDVTWASLKGVYELQAFEVMQAPAGYCGDGVSVVTGAQG